MSEGIDLIEALHDICGQLDECLKELTQRSYSKAEAERVYKICARQKALVEKSAGVSVTFISQFLAGDEEVAEAKAKRDIEEALYYTAQERINVLKLEARIIQSQIEREWGYRNSSASD